MADFPGQETYAYLTPEDRARLRLRERKQTRRCDPGARDGYSYVKTKVRKDGLTVCAFLVGRVFRDARCSIYDRRPHVCQRFKRDGAMCRGAVAAARSMLDEESTGAVTFRPEGAESA